MSWFEHAIEACMMELCNALLTNLTRTCVQPSSLQGGSALVWTGGSQSYLHLSARVDHLESSS